MPFNTIKKAEIFRVRRVALGLLAANPEVKLHLDPIAADAQILEVRTQKCHMGHMAVLQRMLGRNLRDHAVGRDHVENIQPFEHGRCQRNPSVILEAPIARHAGVARLEGNESLQAIVFGALKKMAAPAILQEHRHLLVNLLVQRKLQMPMENVGFGVVLMRCLVGDEWFRHCRHMVRSSGSAHF